MRFLADELETIDRQRQKWRNLRRLNVGLAMRSADDASDLGRELRPEKRYEPLAQQRRPYEAP